MFLIFLLFVVLLLSAMIIFLRNVSFHMAAFTYKNPPKIMSTVFIINTKYLPKQNTKITI